MDIQSVLSQVDVLFGENRGKEAERLMQESVLQAVQEGDDNSLLQLLNELIGYYRETGQAEESFQMAAQAIAQAERMGLENTVPFATTLLNAANAYRAGGRLQESLEAYGLVQEIYGKQLPEDHLFMAGLQNNLSLLYQEMQEYDKAKTCLLKALEIVRTKEAFYEVGVTYANLASTCVRLGELEEAESYAVSSMETFQKIGEADRHYGAALAAMGACLYEKEEYEKAGDYYRQAMELVERGIGKTNAYYRLKEHVEACEKAAEKATEKTAKEAAEEAAEKAAEEEAEKTTEKTAEEAAEKAAEEAAEKAAEEAAEKATEKTAEEAAEKATEKTAEEEAEKVTEKTEEKAEEKAAEKTEEKATEKEVEKGLTLAREYYEAYGAPMLKENFPQYLDKIATGLAGRGSDCFGYDDAVSGDHDWGPDFCLWVTEDVYAQIGTQLQDAYDSLPKEFKGYQKAPRVNGKNRRGVIIISDFYQGLVGAKSYEEIDWRQVSDSSLAAAVNGEVFCDEEGSFTAFREKLMQGYPEDIRLLKIAESAAGFAQTAQYNYSRMKRRGDELTAQMMIWQGIQKAMTLQHYIENRYPPHDKWLRRSLEETAEGRELSFMLQQLNGMQDSQVQEAAERVGHFFAMEMYGRDIISDVDTYLDAHSEELVYKASLAAKSDQELVEDIAKLEFEAFDKVHNEGGRASCQNDWPTFSIMRKSQYMTWNRNMLIQYLYDFHREYGLGHNLIEEKYGRMMASTAPEKYDEIKDHFPQLNEEKQTIIEQICSLQVNWMEEFAKEYPALADNSRSIHTSEDNPFNTSYETYLRGELGTYSDKMLELYGRYIVGYAKGQKNPAHDIMLNNVQMYGYGSLDEAEKKTAGAI